MNRDERLSLTSGLDSQTEFLQRLVYVVQSFFAMSAEMMSSLLQSISSLYQSPLRIRYLWACAICAGCHWLHITLLACSTIWAGRQTEEELAANQREPAAKPAAPLASWDGPLLRLPLAVRILLAVRNLALRI